MKANFADIFATLILKEFLGDVKLKQFDGALQPEEVPIEFITEKKFMMVDEFFRNKNAKYSLPIILKKIAGESESNHRDRVRMFLLACPDTKFSDIAEIINPDNVFHNGFFALYNECMSVKAERQSNYSDNEK
jgi:hypothetical protein